MKACSKCKKTQELAAFHFNKGRKDGLSPHCRECCREYQIKHRERHTTRQREQRKHEKYYKDRRAENSIKSAKRRALRFNVPFDLDQHLDELRERLAVGKCEITGILLSFEGGRTFDSPSLDRIVPELGYVYTNVRWVCDIINTAMGRYGKECLYAVVSTWVGKRSGERITEPNGSGVKEEAGSDIIDAV